MTGEFGPLLERIDTLQRPVIVDIGGEEYHGDQFVNNRTRGTLICVHPDFGPLSPDDVTQDAAVIYMEGGYEGINLPPKTADAVQLNFVATWIDDDPTTTIVKTIDTARHIAKPHAWLEILDGANALVNVEEALRVQRFITTFRILKLHNRTDYTLASERSYRAIHMGDMPIGYLRIRLFSL